MYLYILLYGNEGKSQLKKKKQINKLVFQWDSLYIFIIKRMSLPDYKMGEIQDGDITSQ